MAIKFSYLANPGRFLRFSRKVLPVMSVATALLFFTGIAAIIIMAPLDYKQGETVRIMYVHVPAAWMSLFIYTSMGIAACVAIVSKHVLADLYCKAAAPVGAVFTALCLATGSLWGKPMWGTWWVWDARLTSVLILFFLYIGYIALIRSFDDEPRGLKSGRILLLMGLVNLPIIKFSVSWWNTLHQPASVMRLDGPSIHGSMLWPLILMALAFMFYFASVILMRLEAEISARAEQVQHDR